MAAAHPAESGIDPLGTDKALGLISLSNAEAKDKSANSSKAPVVPVQSGVLTAQSRVYKVYSQDFLVTSGQGF
jgi:hypothetical protein